MYLKIICVSLRRCVKTVVIVSVTRALSLFGARHLLFKFFTDTIKFDSVTVEKYNIYQQRMHTHHSY